MPLPSGELANAWTRSSPPGGAHVGDLWMDTLTGQVNVFNGTDFVPIAVQVVNVKFFGAKGNGITNDAAAIAAADASLAGSAGLLYFPKGTYLVGTNTTTSPNTVLWLTPGAILSPSGGVTLTITGQVQAGLWQVFSGAGTVVISRVQNVYPEWWGALADVKSQQGNGAITSTQTTLTVASGPFAASDVGKIAVVLGAGAAGVPLVTTVQAFISATQVTLALAASTTVTVSRWAIGSDSTGAINKCMVAAGALCPVLLNGLYGSTGVLVTTGQIVLGQEMETSGFYRLGTGASGPTLSLAAGSSGDSLQMSGFLVNGMFIGTFDGVEIGTSGGTLALASGGSLSNIKVRNAAGFGFNVRVNVGKISNPWVQHDQAIPAGNTTAGGIKVIDTICYGDAFTVEGDFPAGPMVLNAAGGSVYNGLQVEITGVHAAVDVISVSGSQSILNSIYATLGTNRNLVRILAGCQDVQVNLMMLNNAHTLTAVLNDIDRAYTIPDTGGVSSYEGYSTFQTSPESGAWQTFAPVWTGFAAASDPTVVSHYKQIGKTIVWSLTRITNGTSNANTLTATLPVAASLPGGTPKGGAGWGIGTDNGAPLTTPVRIDISSTTIATFYTRADAGVWTNVNAKSVSFTLTYEAG